jgi:hypothetical protein
VRRDERTVKIGEDSGAIVPMHPAGFQFSNGMIKGSFLAVAPCRTAPKSSLLAEMRHAI